MTDVVNPYPRIRPQYLLLEDSDFSAGFLWGVWGWNQEHPGAAAMMTGEEGLYRRADGSEVPGFSIRRAGPGGRALAVVVYD